MLHLDVSCIYSISVYLMSSCTLYYYQQYQNSNQNTKYAIVRAQELIEDYNTYLHTLKTEKNTNLNRRHDIKLRAMCFQTTALNVLEL